MATQREIADAVSEALKTIHAKVPGYRVTVLVRDEESDKKSLLQTNDIPELAMKTMQGLLG